MLHTAHGKSTYRSPHLTNSSSSGSDASTCLGRQREKFRRDVKDMQDAFTAFEECRKPVIAAIHGACIGGGIDMVTACDLRYCTEVCSTVHTVFVVV